MYIFIINVNNLFGLNNAKGNIKMKKVFFALIMICVSMLSLCVYANTVSNDLENGIIRLHILARSDSSYDQTVKLEIRDRILDAVSDIPITDTDMFVRVAEDSANEYLRDAELPYRARAEYGNFMFPRKSYGNITLPAGYYNGVRVILDEGKGQNWWCVMYPPLCVTDKSEAAQAVLESSLNGESYKLITKKPEIRFKILELLAQII